VGAGSTVKKRPAETGGLAGSLALSMAHAFGVNRPGILTAIGAASGAIPATVTFVVARGGVGGVWRTVVSGREGEQTAPPTATGLGPPAPPRSETRDERPPSRKSPARRRRQGSTKSEAEGASRGVPKPRKERPKRRSG
jgi:hypothetical protein